MSSPLDTYFTDKALEYAKGVGAGLIPACKWTVLACKRQLADLEKQGLESWPYYFDLREANRICRVIELFPHIKGEWARVRPDNPTAHLLRLEPWQCFILTTVFGWRDKGTRFRRFRTAYIEVPRKNAKSTLTSGVALYCLGPDEEPGAECYSAATTRDQARIVFKDAQIMALRTPGYRERFGVTVGARTVYRHDTSSKFEALSADSSSLDGLNVHFAAIDELHAHKTRAVFDVIETATGSREQSLMWCITTAGVNIEGVCYEQHIYLKKILDGLHEDETYFGIIYSIDEEDDWTDPIAWAKANPNLNVSVKLADLERLCSKAKASPSAQNNFKTKRLNVWVGAGEAWMNMQEWAACRITESPAPTLESFRRFKCLIGLDLASKVDVASMSLLFEKDGKKYPFHKFYLPEAVVLEAGKRSIAHYDAWAKMGFITLTPGNVLDFEVIKDDLRAMQKLFRVEAIAYDPWQATQLAVEMLAEGAPMVEYGTTVKNFSEPMKTLEGWVLNREIAHVHNPAFDWMLGNVVVQMDRKENIFPRKETKAAKIDGPISLIQTVGLLVSDKVKRKTTIYDSGAGVMTA